MEIERKEIDTKSVKQCGLPCLWFLGGPGSGKTTQCATLARMKDYIHVPPDQLVNREVESGSTRGMQLTKVIGMDEPVPTPVLIDIISEYMVKQLAEYVGPEGKAKGFLIDGFPCSLDHAQQFLAKLCKVTKIIHLELSPDGMMERMLKNAVDMEKTEKLIASFEQETMPILETYKDRVIKVDGSEMSFICTADITRMLMDAGLWR